jgi:hypothetical protein
MSTPFRHRRGQVLVELPGLVVDDGVEAELVQT